MTNHIRSFSYRTILRVGLLLLCGILSLSCNRNTPVDPLDPSTPPMVISTYPQNGSVGPFDMNGEMDRSFFVYFNKIIDRSSLTPASVVVDGFSEQSKAFVVPFSSPSTLTDVVKFWVGFKGSPEPYKIGRRYTVTLDSTIRDLSGNHLSHPYTFSFVPEPKFRVKSVFPVDGDTIRSFYGNDGFLELQTNSPVDSTEVQRACSISPALPGHWVTQDGATSSSIFTFHPEGAMPPGQSFILTVNGDLHDRFGNVLGETWSSKFYPPTLMVWHWETPYDLERGIECLFNAEVDSAEFQRAIRVTPVTPFHVEKVWDLSDRYLIVPDNGWLPNSAYRFEVVAQLHAINGSLLTNPIIMNFTTEEFRANNYGPQTVSSTDRYVYRNETIWIQYNARVDSVSASRAVHISPPVFGHTVFYSQAYSFQPDSLMAPFTTYTVTVDSTVRSIRGYHLRQGFSYTFKTGGEVRP